MKTRRSSCSTHISALGAKPSIPGLLDYKDLAKITGESVMTHRRRKMLGIGPRALRLGRHIRFHPKDVAVWLESCAQAAGSPKEAA